MPVIAACAPALRDTMAFSVKVRCAFAGGSAFYCADGLRHNVTAGFYSAGGTSSTTRTPQCTAASRDESRSAVS